MVPESRDQTFAALEILTKNDKRTVQEKAHTFIWKQKITSNTQQ
jgi:hypothetical protein